jgi:hypothetical protein
MYLIMTKVGQMREAKGLVGITFFGLAQIRLRKDSTLRMGVPLNATRVRLARAMNGTRLITGARGLQI